MALQIEQFLVGGFDKNFSYVLYCDVTKEACIIDPSGNFALIEQRIVELEVDVVAILLTHTHADHVDALGVAQARFLVPVFVHEKGVTAVSADMIQPVVDGNEIELGDDVIAVVHTPGHSEDSVGYVCTSATNQLWLIAGDTVFIDGCGRTDDAGVRDLYNSIQFIKELPPETLIWPGHNYGPVPVDTLANQLLTNRFLRATNFTDFCIERLGYTINT